MEPRLACWLVLLPCACQEARPPRYWVADRAAEQVIALDEELCVLERIPVAAPGWVSADRLGLWVAADDRLVRIEPPGGVAASSGFGRLVALEADAQGCAFVLERQAEHEHELGRPASAALLWRVERDQQQRTLLGAFPLATALALQAGLLLVGGTGGELALLRRDGAVLAFGSAAGPVRALAQGPRAGEWWVLAGTDGPSATGTSLQLLDRSLALLWSVPCPRGASGFAAVAGERRVWISGASSLLCAAPEGAFEVALGLGAGPWSAGLATRSGVLLLGPGALLELEVRHGCASVRRTQGGFAALVALAWAAQG